jgi:hypothetical protein
MTFINVLNNGRAVDGIKLPKFTVNIDDNDTEEIELPEKISRIDGLINTIPQKSLKIQMRSPQMMLS